MSNLAQLSAIDEKTLVSIGAALACLAAVMQKQSGMSKEQFNAELHAAAKAYGLDDTSMAGAALLGPTA